MITSEFIEKNMQSWAAVRAVGPSAMRGQGKGVLEVTHRFLGSGVLTDLLLLAEFTQEKYAAWLDKQTESLLDGIEKVLMRPENERLKKKRPWGVARKALNLFMRDVFYNKYLNALLGIEKLEACLEVPLDSAVGKRLLALPSETIPGRPDKWPGLQGLKSPISEWFQAAAALHAKSWNIERVHLDVVFWPPKKSRSND